MTLIPLRNSSDHFRAETLKIHDFNIKYVFHTSDSVMNMKNGTVVDERYV